MAIDDNTLYGLTGAQIKELPGKIEVKIGSTVSPAPATAYVGTTNIIDGAVTASKINLSTLGGNYSTSEVDTGYTWINGDHVYKKTYSTGALPNNAENNIPHGISNLKRVIKVEGFAYKSYGTWTLPLMDLS